MDEDNCPSHYPRELERDEDAVHTWCDVCGANPWVPIEDWDRRR